MQTKQQLRERIWEALHRQGVALFPGAVGRIPNFEGATEAAELACRLQVWQRASVLKCNPDSPQLPLRRAGLREGKTIYMAVPRLRQEHCFIELDPERLGRRASAAATIRGPFRYGRPVTIDELPPIDLVVCGSVAVNREGARLGKGGGYSDLEYALAFASGKFSRDTPILTTVHPLRSLRRRHRASSTTSLSTTSSLHSRLSRPARRCRGRRASTGSSYRWRRSRRSRRFER